MLSTRWIAGTVAALSILALAGAPGAQPPATDTKPGTTPVPGVPSPGPGPTPPAKEQEREAPAAPERAAEPLRVPEELFPTRTTPTIVGPNLFNPPAQQGWLTVTPSFTLSGEYNDNIGLSSRARQTDGIIGLTPGLTLSAQKRGVRLYAGYNTSGEIFIENSDFNDFGKQQQFIGDLYYEISPRVTFTLTDGFVFGRESSALTSGGVSVGFQESWRNTITPALRWQATPSTGVSLVASYTIVRFKEDAGGGEDSDTVRVGLGTDHRFTARFTGTLDAGVAYIKIKSQPEAWTYTPSVGFSYEITPTLRASVRGGPSFFERDGDSAITPSVSGTLAQTFKFGTALIGYDRAVTAETVGSTDRQAIFASVFVPTLVRGLQLEFTPRYAINDEDITGGSSNSIKTLTLNLRASYQIARNISVIGAYTFFRQTSDNSRDDIDQNRVFLGLQYAFPINFY